MRADDEDIIGTKPPPPDQTAGLGLFAEAEASAALAQEGEARTVSRSAMPGAGQAARADARARAKRTTEDAYRCIAQSIEAHGPQTRKELEVSCGMPVNTINARVAELRDAEQTPEYPDWRLLTDGRRDGQSIVHLARLHHPAPAPPTVPSPEDPV